MRHWFASSHSTTEGELIMKLKNESASTVYFSHCNYRIGFWIERKVNDSWVDAGNIAILCQALYPSGRKTFPVGQVSRDTITLTETGTYRHGFSSWEREPANA